ncbi:transporter [Rodentibacter genomosp. 2]|uniref:oligosaccharide flippase family protein n=1 Tax=Rodentibacter genomosp. 2 TaxID=1908266 RepID=UPI0009858202|nr:transporter [Rodentibacter genomosp. 2]
MIDKLLKSKDNKKLLENFISLFILQGMNYLLPLITFPYLVKILGIENFGVLAFSTAVIAYFGMITDYGFNITATRDISINKSNNQKVIEIFSSVIVIKILLCIISFFTLYILVNLIDSWRKYQEIYYLTFGIVVGQIFLPIWFYQGMEKMKFFSMCNVMAKIIATIVIFVFVKNENDSYVVPLANSLAMIISGVFSFWLISKHFKVNFLFPDFAVLNKYFIESWHIFISNFFGNFYRNFNILALGFFASELIVGYYAIAEKIIKIIQMAQEIVGNVLFPHFSAKLVNDRGYFFNFHNKFFKYILTVFIIISISIFFLAEAISDLLNGLEHTIYNIKIMSSVITIGGLNYYFGILGLLTMGKNKIFANCILITGISNIIISYILIYLLKDIGASFSLVLSESILLVLLVFQIKKLRNIEGL